MRIKKMTATFGRLNNAVLTPGPGLTVIQAPNEGGKSTWSGFLKAMLYGVDTKERDKNGFLAEKNRYQPWSGSPMAGELQVEWNGRDITLRRFAARSFPFGGFSAVYTATGDPVPGLTAANAGEVLTGAGRDLFTRTALVGQNASAVTASPELEKRVASLVATGQEEVSFSAVERRLKDWRNRRQSNRANGLIPELDGELRRRTQALQAMEEDRRLLEAAEKQLRRLETERLELTTDLEAWERVRQHQLNREYAQAREAWEDAQARVDQWEPHPIFGTMSGEEAWAMARRKQAERDAALAENRMAEERRAQAEARLGGLQRRLRLFALAGGLFLLTAVLLALAFQLWPCVALLAAAAVLMLVLAWNVRRQVEEAEAALSTPVQKEAPAGDDLLAQAADYRENLARLEMAQRDADAAKRRMDDLYAQGGRPFDTLELVHTPALSRQELKERLEQVDSGLRSWRAQRDRASGALRSDPLTLEAEAGQLEVQLARRQEEYQALDMALEALTAANAALRERFSPVLNQRAGVLFSQLTGGAHAGLVLSRDFSALVTGQDGSHSHLYLSAGTMDQLYLAVRLALCDMALPDAPILLDDALSAFDDTRMALALDCLSRMAERRQILLFTCHSREAGWAQAHNIPVLALN